MSESSPTIWVSVETEEAVAETPVTGSRDGGDIGGGWGKPAAEAVERVLKRKRVTLDARLLKEQMAGLLAIVDDLFEQAAQKSQMELEELELSVEIDGEGQVNLVGNCVKLGSTGGITMKFKAKK